MSRVKSLHPQPPLLELVNKLRLPHLFALSPILAYSLIMAFVYAADGLMSYVSPLYIEEHVANPALMGIVFAFSSLVGFFCDILFAKWFRGKPYGFFLKRAMGFALLFPAFFLFLPGMIPTLLLGMAVWGVYYELEIFTNFHFIHEWVKPSSHASAWGLLSVFKCLAYAIAPLVAARLLNISMGTVLLTVIILLILGIMSAVIFKYTHQKKEKQGTHPSLHPSPSLKVEGEIWRALLKKIWPLYLFFFSLFIIDSTFWTVGTLLSEELRQQSVWGGFLLTAYVLPSLFFGLLAGRLAKPFGKKRISFITGLFGGLCLMLVGFITQPILIVATVFISSAFFAITWPEMYATFEDYVSRLGDFGVDMIGLQSSASSASYILGPIIAGILATLLGIHMTFTIIGLNMVIISLLMLVIVPRKIKMPIKELIDVSD